MAVIPLSTTDDDRNRSPDRLGQAGGQIHTEGLKARIAELSAELAEAEAQLREIEEGARLEALVKVRNLMRAFELTPANLGLVPTPKRHGRPRKVHP